MLKQQCKSTAYAISTFCMRMFHQIRRAFYYSYTSFCVHLQRLAVEIVVSGIVFHPDDFLTPWEAPDGDLERYLLNILHMNVDQCKSAIFHGLLFTSSMYINSTIFKRSAEMEFYFRYALRWETENVMAVSTAIQDWLTSGMLLSFHFF